MAPLTASLTGSKKNLPRPPTTRGDASSRSSSSTARTGLRALAAALVGAAALAGPAHAASVPAVAWSDCRDAPGMQCALYSVPRDYSRPADATLQLALVRLPATDPAHRIGSLFVNFGGPGAPGVDSLKGLGPFLFSHLNTRFDIVGFDPRGVGQSSSAVDCHVNQETEGLFAQPFTTPENLDLGALVTRDRAYITKCLTLNAAILPYLSTANVARDLDTLRQAVGDDKLSYLGFSYGTFLGATYAAMFPHNYRALALDGALDADQYINDPLDNTRAQTAAFERAIGRFLQTCALHVDVCSLGNGDPWTGLDDLIDQADATPIPAFGRDPRAVTGDDIRAAALQMVYAKQLWPLLAFALEMAQGGDGTGIRAIADFFYGRLPDGSYDPFGDRFFAISAADLQYPKTIGPFVAAGMNAWASFDHAYFNSGFGELPWGLDPVVAKGVFTGPFRTAASSPTVLVVGTKYDPATPYRGAKRLVSELGNARLLTMRGDGHTAYGLGSACIDSAVNDYLLDGTLPAAGTVCNQNVPFDLPVLSQARTIALGVTGRTDRILSRFVRR
jgi:pimeloyl-ACP methyl ester carboxylesterase